MDSCGQVVKFLFVFLLQFYFNVLSKLLYICLYGGCIYTPMTWQLYLPGETRPIHLLNLNVLSQQCGWHAQKNTATAGDSEQAFP